MKVTPFAKFTVLVNCAVPVTILAWDAWHGQLGANPVNFAIRTTGILALTFLLLSLSVTPASRITGWSGLVVFRRMLGLYAFFHALLHFLLFFGFDREGNVESTLAEMIKRPYLLVGSVGLILMVPLAVTSTDGMIKWLGPRRWKGLHRLAYVIAIAGVVHYYMLVKADVAQPLAFGAALGVLLFYRVVGHYLGLRSAYKKLLALPAANGAAGPVARPKFWSGQLRVAKVFDETPTVRTFRLVPVSGTQLPFDFMPGQYLNLLLRLDGKKVARSYTIASSPTRTVYCELTVKREDLGLSSRHLHDAVVAGTLLDISVPAGRFTFTGNEAECVVMIAGGVGITPLMSKIRYLTDTSWPGEIYLVFAVKTERDIIFRDELEYLAKRHPKLYISITLTRDDSPSWTGLRGRISPDLLAEVVPQIATRHVHICGPDDMAQAVVKMLELMGVPEEQIKLESFTPANRAEPTELELTERNGASEIVTGVASVTFARSGRSKTVLATESVLEASEALGVDIAYDCRSGICGQCKTTLLAGHVIMDIDAALDASDRANKRILSCQAICLDDVVVDA